VHVTLTPLPPLPTSWLPVPLCVSSLGTPRITRGTGALTSPPVGSSSLAMWCLMSLSSPSPPPPPHLPPPIRTPSLCFPLTRWSSHFYRCLLQVMLPRAPARRLPVTPLALRPARVRRRRPPELLLPLRPQRVRGRRLSHLLRVSPSRCTSTGAVCRRHRCLRHHRGPLLHW